MAAINLTQNDDVADYSASNDPLEICRLGGNDTITGGHNSDYIDGGEGNDILRNAGNNYLQGFANNDILDGGAGNDYYELGDRNFVGQFDSFDYDPAASVELDPPRFRLAGWLKGNARKPEPCDRAARPASRCLGDAFRCEANG